MKDMRLNFYEKLVVIILMAALFTGSIILFIRDRRPCREIVIIKKGTEEKVTLKQVKKQLTEAQKININSATVNELISIPLIGKVLAAKIVEYRNIHGSFCSRESLLEIDGIGKKKLEKISEYLKID